MNGNTERTMTVASEDFEKLCRHISIDMLINTRQWAYATQLQTQTYI